MHPAEIIALLKIRGFSQTDIAAACGEISPSTVSQVIHGNARSKKVEMCVAAASERPLAKLWPQWYGPNAVRKPRRSSPAERAKRMAELAKLANEFQIAQAG